MASNAKITSPSFRGPLGGDLTLPGCKSFTNRALLCAARASGSSTILHPSTSDDTELMLNLLKSAGVSLERREGSVLVKGVAGFPRYGKIHLNLGNAGTVMRFGLPFLAAGEGEAILEGSPRMHRRPIGPLVSALRNLGATIDYLGEEGFPPLRLKARGLAAKAQTIPGDLSSQFLSGLLLAGVPAQPRGHLRSAPYVELTHEILAEWGHPGPLTGKTFEVPGDPSAAFIFAVAVGVGGGQIRFTNLGKDPVSRKLGGISLLESLGLKITMDGESLTVMHGPMQGGTWNLEHTPDLVPPLAVAALFASGNTVLEGIPHLKIKESDRLGTFATELARCGASVEAGPDFLAVKGDSSLHGAILDCHDDHRLAMSFALLSFRIASMQLRGADCVSKSVPDFFSLMESLQPAR